MGRGGFAEAVLFIWRSSRMTRQNRRKRKIVGAGGPWIASIAYRIPKTRVQRTARHSLLSMARRKGGRGNGEMRISLCPMMENAHRGRFGFA
ncbi:hypothetical protein FHW16_003539 [Phyllobacterium myrsinacearum]|uniref:Uncharacterized protein n=1 Tax=Phyllobacterium myrsinacearum TaxID=28101 RepID=A0A839ET98_9HYPH|nr:hypothetical protein [Phyllobacterium myrsinacearum]